MRLPILSSTSSRSKHRFAPILLPCSFFILFFANTVSAQTTKPVAHWSFDEADGDTIHDSIGQANGKITGVYKHVPGVLSNGLRLDGETSGVTVAAADVPHLKDSFTIDGWIAINAYPWNWVPIVDNRRAEQAGYLFGIDSFGHLGLQLSANGVWQSLISQERLPLKRWSHVAATFDESKGMTLYIDGKSAGELKVQPPFAFAEKADLLIGRVRQPLLPAQWIHPEYAVWYSFDGIRSEEHTSELQSL